MTEPTLEASLEATDSLSIETHPDDVWIAWNAEKSKPTDHPIQRAFVKLIDRIISL
jgi:hypothetical protein